MPVFSEGQCYLIQSRKQGDRVSEPTIIVASIEKIDEKGSMVKLVPLNEEYDNKYFRIPYFEWLLYTGDIKPYVGT
jgi:hypothetical protein